MNLSGVREGGTVFVVDVANGLRRGDKGYTLPVSKVTKQTVYAQQYGKKLAFSVESGWQKQDPWGHLCAWVSEADFRAERAIEEAWREFRNNLHSAPPPHITLDDINAIRAKLKGPNNGTEPE